jgi:hypothetical protein
MTAISLGTLSRRNGAVHVSLCPTNNALQISHKRNQKCGDAGYCARILIQSMLETFGGTYCLHLQGRWISRAKSSFIYHLLSRWLLERFILRRWGWRRYSSETSADFQRTTRRCIPEHSTLHKHRCENLKSYICWKHVTRWSLLYAVLRSKHQFCDKICRDSLPQSAWRSVNKQWYASRYVCGWTILKWILER